MNTIPDYELITARARALAMGDSHLCHDLAQVGYLGLCKAQERRDAMAGEMPWRTYLYRYVDGYMRMEMRTSRRQYPVTTMTSFDAVINGEDTLSDGSPDTLADHLADPTEEVGFSDTLDTAREVAGKALACLTPIERQVIELAMGFANDGDTYNNAEIAEMLSYTRAGVGVILDRAFAKMRKTVK